MRFLFSVAVLAACLVSAGAHAAFSIAEIQVAAGEAVKDFQAAEQAHVAHFVGYKIWKSGEESKVKIYVDHNGHNMEFNYMCHKHDARIECHAQ